MKNLLLAIVTLALLVFLFSHFGVVEETQPEPSGGVPILQGDGLTIIGDGDLVIYEQAPTPQAKKTNTEIAYEVIYGKWGNGAERKRKLTAEGYNHKAVQAIVNDILE